MKRAWIPLVSRLDVDSTRIGALGLCFGGTAVLGPHPGDRQQPSPITSGGPQKGLEAAVGRDFGVKRADSRLSTARKRG